jgi:hypothetical protein
VTTIGFPGGQTEGRMTTEGHVHSGNKNFQQQENVALDKNLVEIRARMDELEFGMQQDTKSRWVYEWPMKKTKIKWPVKELMARRHRRLLRRWLRHAKNLNE